MDEPYIIYAEESGDRIDALLARHLEDCSRSAVQRLIEEGRVTRAGLPVRKNGRAEAGECFVVRLPELQEIPLLPQEIPLDVA